MTARVILDRKARQLSRELRKMAPRQPIPQARRVSVAQKLHQKADKPAGPTGRD